VRESVNLLPVRCPPIQGTLGFCCVKRPKHPQPMMKTFEGKAPATAVSHPGLYSESVTLAEQAGFTDIVHVEGGLNGWRNEGYPTEEVE
jgi:hypothetical protein